MHHAKLVNQRSKVPYIPSLPAQVVHARARRRFQRGLKRKPMGLIKKLRKAKKEALPNEKPPVVKTHLRDMIIVPEMIGSVVGIYNGKVSTAVSQTVKSGTLTDDGAIVGLQLR